MSTVYSQKNKLGKKITFKITPLNHIFRNIYYQRRERSLQQNVQDTEKVNLEDTR